MKKILFATTALVATASVAAADVTFSGYGRFGLKYEGSVAGVDAKDGEIVAADHLNTLNAAVETYTGTADDVLEEDGVLGQSGTAVAPSAAAASVDTAIAAARAAIATATTAAETAQDLYDADAGTGASLADLATLQEAIDKENDLIADLNDFIEGTGAADEVAAIASDMMITSRILLDIDASAETESGVTFGTMIRLRQTDGGTNSFNAARFYAKSGGLEVGVGNIFGAMDSMPGAYGQAVGLTGLSYAGLVTGSSMSYSSTGAGAAGSKEAVEVTYSLGDFSMHVSTNGTDTEGFAAYSMDGWTVAAAMSDTDTAANTESALTVSGKIGDVTLGFGTAKTKGGDQQTTVSGKYSVGAATTVNAYYNDNEANTIDDKSYGIGFAHDLGGATLKGGVEKTNDQTLADFGVLFNF